MSVSGEFEWYIHRGDRPVGPMTSHELAMLAVAGHVGGKDVVWCHGLAEWVPLGRALGVAETAEAQARNFEARAPDKPSGRHSAPSLSQLYRDGLPVRAGQSVPPPAPRAPARSPTAQPAYASPRAPIPTRPVADVASPPPPTITWQPTPARTTAVTRYDAPVPAFETDAPAMGLASWAAPYTPATNPSGGMRDTIANALIAVMEKHGIRTVDDLAGNKSLETLASGTFDYLPWTIRTTISMTVGRPACEKRLLDLMLAARARWLASSTRDTDLRLLVRDMIHSNRIEEWLSGAYNSVVGGIGGVKSSIVSTLSKGLGGDAASAPPGVPPPPLAIAYAGQGGTYPR